MHTVFIEKRISPKLFFRKFQLDCKKMKQDTVIDDRTVYFGDPAM